MSFKEIIRYLEQQLPIKSEQHKSESGLMDSPHLATMFKRKVIKELQKMSGMDFGMCFKIELTEVESSNGRTIFKSKVIVDLNLIKHNYNFQAKSTIEASVTDEIISISAPISSSSPPLLAPKPSRSMPNLFQMLNEYDDELNFSKQPPKAEAANGEEASDFIKEH